MTSTSAAAILEWSLRYPPDAVLGFPRETVQQAFDMLVELLEHANDYLYDVDTDGGEEP